MDLCLSVQGLIKCIMAPFMATKMAKTILDFIECTHSIPQCTVISSVQPMYTKWLVNTHNAL